MDRKKLSKGVLRRVEAYDIDFIRALDLYARSGSHSKVILQASDCILPATAVFWVEPGVRGCRSGSRAGCLGRAGVDLPLSCKRSYA